MTPRVIHGNEDELLCTCGRALYDPAEGFPGEDDVLKCDGCTHTWKIVAAEWAATFDAEEVAP